VAISRDEVLKIAELAKLHFSEEDLDEFTLQFQRILDYIEKLKEVDVQGVAPTSHVSQTQDQQTGVERGDEPRPSLPVEVALANAPDPGCGHFRVPKVL
jgi:aspartyl-tRNA(Asn)/glutamyl-tRNA(Gln) amidotransferase subunit C